jgi:hypothetical protein
MSPVDIVERGRRRLGEFVDRRPTRCVAGRLELRSSLLHRLPLRPKSSMRSCARSFVVRPGRVHPARDVRDERHARLRRSRAPCSTPASAILGGNARAAPAFRADRALEPALGRAGLRDTGTNQQAHDRRQPVMAFVKEAVKRRLVAGARLPLLPP